MGRKTNSASTKKQTGNLNSTFESDSLASAMKNEFSNSAEKHKYVEPLPESSRERKDGPGGEDGQ